MQRSNPAKAAPGLRRERKILSFEEPTMTTHKPFVRETFFIFLCATVIGLTLTATAFNTFLIPKAISQNVHPLLSPADSYNSSAGAVSRSRTVVGDRSSAGSSFRNVLTLSPARIPDALDKVLAKTADENKTVIITALNGAWAKPNSMIDLFMESFHVGEGTQKMLNNLLIVGLDAKAYNRCLAIHPHCYKLKTSGVDFSAEKVFMSQDYLKMMWRRLGFLAEILKRGYNFVFSDADIMWLRDPFPRLSTEADIQIASDRFNGRPYDVYNLANSGYLYVRSNDQTIRFYRYWYLSRRLYPGLSEQNVLNIIKFRSSFGKKGFRFVFLDTKYFGGFCERSPYLDDVYTMHANCCRGLKAKLIDLRQTLDDWIRYRGKAVGDRALEDFEGLIKKNGHNLPASLHFVRKILQIHSHSVPKLFACNLSSVSIFPQSILFGRFSDQIPLVYRILAVGFDNVLC